MGGVGGANLDKEHKIKGQDPWKTDPGIPSANDTSLEAIILSLTLLALF